MKSNLKLLSFVVLIAAFCFSCQEKQVPKHYFDQSPEIDIAKKAVDAYLNKDWVTVKSCYSDTAKIWHNVYWAKNPGKSIDEAIEESKTGLASIVSYKYEGIMWEMIINTNDEKWVHFRGNWIGKLSEESDEIEIVVHIDYCVAGGKIVQEAGFWDNLPLYLAQQKLNSQSN